MRVNYIFPGTEEELWDFSPRLMAAQSQDVSLQPIDWPSQIRAELHEPINGSDSSGPVGESEIEQHRLFSPLVFTFPRVFILLLFFLLLAPLSKTLR